ncbi:hypothetical protein CBR_g46735 [Chara braunii]|uniref:Reverse transcriptase domain-containing protein n=1 Tax=Chara braunii TaxID=69332 RepID=A0A388K445_CHABU|nr:hypothetical protein CBR_g46735 [Chara braunii]|eukprot:GBG64779.1 hypothetical protein CBR_g46735 [Chara braunii]
MTVMDHPFVDQQERQHSTRGILKCVTEFYRQLLMEEEAWTSANMAAEPEQEVWKHIQSHLSLNSTCRMEADVTREEVERSITALPRLKAPGLDRVPVELFKDFCNFFVTLLTAAYNEALRVGTFPPGFVDGYVVLLYKKGPKVLEEDQCTGRVRAFISTDLEKVYDRVWWEFMLQSMAHRGVGGIFCSWFRSLLRGANTVMKVNGVRLNSLRVSRLEGLKTQSKTLQTTAFADDTGASLCRQGSGCILQVIWAMSQLAEIKSSDAPGGGPAGGMGHPESREWGKNGLLRSKPDPSYGGVEQMAIRAVAAVARLRAWSAKGSMGVFGKALVVKNSTLATLWYARAVHMPGKRTFRYIKHAIHAHLWSNNAAAEDSTCRVAWDKLIQPRRFGGLGLLDPRFQIISLQIRQLIWVLLGTMGDTWQEVTRAHLAYALQVPEKMVETCLLSSSLIGHIRRGTVWSTQLTLWKKVQLRCRMPASADAVFNQLLFDNKFICDEEGDPFPWQGQQGAFGWKWAERGVFKVGHLWDEDRKDWRTDSEMMTMLVGKAWRMKRVRELREVMPSQWIDVPKKDKVAQGERVRIKGVTRPDMVYRVEQPPQEEWLDGKPLRMSLAAQR